MPFGFGQLPRFELQISKGPATVIRCAGPHRAFELAKPLQRARRPFARTRGVLATKVASRGAHLLGDPAHRARGIAVLPRLPRLPRTAHLPSPPGLP